MEYNINGVVDNLARMAVGSGTIRKMEDAPAVSRVIEVRLSACYSFPLSRSERFEMSILERYGDVLRKSPTHYVVDRVKDPFAFSLNPFEGNLLLSVFSIGDGSESDFFQDIVRTLEDISEQRRLPKEPPYFHIDGVTFWSIENLYELKVLFARHRTSISGLNFKSKTFPLLVTLDTDEPTFIEAPALKMMQAFIAATLKK